MYPYFYPSFFTPDNTGFPGQKNQRPPQQPAAPMGEGPTAPPAGFQEPPTTGSPQMQQAPQQIPPDFGTTSGSPVESVPPTQPYVQQPAVTFEQQEGPPVMTDIGFTQGYLRTQIGKKVRIEFLIGTNSTTDRIGTLIGVGISYVLIRPTETDDIMLCDIYSIKFVTIFE